MAILNWNQLTVILSCFCALRQTNKPLANLDGLLCRFSNIESLIYENFVRSTLRFLIVKIENRCGCPPGTGETTQEPTMVVGTPQIPETKTVSAARAWHRKMTPDSWDRFHEEKCILKSKIKSTRRESWKLFTSKAINMKTHAKLNKVIYREQQLRLGSIRTPSGFTTTQDESLGALKNTSRNVGCPLPVTFSLMTPPALKLPLRRG